MAPLRMWKRKKDGREESPDSENEGLYLRRLASFERFTGILDRKGRLQFVSESAVSEFGYSSEQVVGLPFWETAWFKGALQAQKLAEDSIKRALDGGSAEWEAEASASDGMSLPVVFRASPLVGVGADKKPIVGISAEPKAFIEQKKAARETEALEERFNALMGMMQGGYFRADKDDRLTVVCPYAAEVLGYGSPEDLVGKEMAMVWASPPQKTKLERILAERGRVDSYKATLKKRDESTLSVEVNAHQLYDPDGEPLGMEGFFKEIVEEVSPKAREREELKEEESHFRAMAELVKDFYFRADEDGFMTMASPAGARVFGYGSAEEVVGKRTNEFWVSAEERKKFLNQLEKKGKALGFKATFKRKNGEPVVVEMDCHLLRDAAGEVMGTQGVFRDISERVKYEEELEKSNAELERAKAEVEQLMDEKVRRLVESEDRYFSLVERASDGVILVQDSVIKFANNAFARMTGYDSIELTDMEFASLLGPGSVDVGVGRYERLMAGEEGTDVCELELLRKNGETLWVEVNSSLIEHDDEPAGLVIVRDLSARKRVERPVEKPVQKPPEELHLARKLEIVERVVRGEDTGIYRLVVENASDGIIIVQGTNTEDVVFVNKRACEISGYTEERVRKEAKSKGFAFWSAMMGATDPVVVQEMAQAFMERRRSIRWFELDLVRPDGSVMPSELSMSFLDVEGVGTYVVFIRDVTAKRQAEEERREAEARYESIFNHTPELIFICDPDGRLTDANGYALEQLGYAREELVGKSYFEIVDPEDISKAKDVFADIVANGTSTAPVGQRLKGKSGEVVWIDYVGTLLQRGGKSSAVLGIARNVTEQKMWEETLEQSEQRLRDALRKLKMSHEELSVPVVQIWDNILALPLIGVVDDIRAQHVMEILLNRIVQTQSELVILDVTGVDAIDTQVTDHLFKTIRACSLLGAHCVLTGINPEMAQTVISIGWDSRQFVIRRDLQDGLKWSLKNMGYELRNGH